MSFVSRFTEMIFTEKEDDTLARASVVSPEQLPEPLESTLPEFTLSKWRNKETLKLVSFTF